MRNLYVDVDQLVWKDDLETLLQVLHNVLTSVMFGPAHLLHPFCRLVGESVRLMLHVALEITLELQPIVSVCVCVCHHVEYSVC